MRIRAMTPADDLMPFLLLAMNWQENGTWDSERVLATPAVAHYIEGWMREGDTGLVAEDGAALGCAWWRYADASAPGYGYVADDVTEIGLAIVPPARGNGIGRALTVALIELARVEGLPGLSLSVEDGNAAARRLYISLGFRTVGRSGDSDTMLVRL